MDNAFLLATQERLKGVIDRWGKLPNGEDEALDIKMSRALLNLAAYEDDAKRSLAGERPIRTDYPLPLPKQKPQVFVKWDDYGQGYYDQNDKPLFYYRSGHCPVNHIEELGEHLGFDFLGHREMTEKESESWC